VRRLVLLGMLGVAALALPAAPASAADECEGLLVCIPVAGPWVVVPSSASSTSSARWRLRCPEGSAVGGTDARASERFVEVSFPGRVGSPVGPGVTTSDAVLFTGRYAGAARGHGTSFRPYIGCIPGSGGGRRIPTSARPDDPVASASASASAVRPGTPVTVRTKTLRVGSGQLARGSLRCQGEERLLRGSAVVGLETSVVPTAAQLGSVAVVRVVRDGRVLVSARRQGLPEAIVARVQIQAECAR